MVVPVENEYRRRAAGAVIAAAVGDEGSEWHGRVPPLLAFGFPNPYVPGG